MNTTTRTVSLYHNGQLISAQPWILDEAEQLFVPSDELVCFYPEWNDAITPDTADVWDELHGLTISEVQDSLMFGKTTGSCSVASISYEAVITYTIN